MIKDLTSWKVTRTLIIFALPMLIWNIFHQLYNLVDTIIVWRYISDLALASVGAAFPIFFLLLSISIWLATWASVIVSQLFGAKDLKNVKKSSYTALLSTLVIWILIGIFWFFFSGSMLRLLNTPENIFEWSKQYLQIIFIFGVFIFVHNMATSIFNALWDSKTPLIVMIASALMNVFLDLLFIITFKLWVAWAALATWISWISAMLMSNWILLYRLRKIKTEKLDSIFDFSLLKSMTKIAIPTMLNQSLVAFWTLVVQGVINWFWSNIIAWYAAASKVDSLAMMPILNLSAALAAFAAQNLWSWQIGRVKEWFRSSLMISVCFSVIMAIIIFFIWGEIMKIFLDTNANNEIIEFWRNYLMVVAFGYIIMWFLFNSGSILRAAWAMRPYVISTIVSIWIKIAAAYILVWLMWSSVIWWSVIMGWGVWAIISMYAYLKWNWQVIKIIDSVDDIDFDYRLAVIRESLINIFSNEEDINLAAAEIPVK